MSTSSLVGKHASFFLDGGWEISGLVASQESDKIILDRDGELYLLFKAKVNFVKIEKSESPKKDNNIRHISDQGSPVKEDFVEEVFPENGISYSETFLNIPRSLLGRESQQQDDEDDLSISFKESNTNNVLNFKVEDDS